MMRKLATPVLSPGLATPGRALPSPREGASHPPRVGRAPQFLAAPGGER